ncbi:Alpha/beta hydrolase domain-containing protein 17A [Camellia lanceoleosa]|uniref:Alpha/beta hydrolase domain-containing protein 17A n=1 Tax=Camellia lanceoleosa TaxID=1840588 RepID=A0ACC0I084_9ERIC|nr:Alpha/beta hydrolase domain-containing protein 17A [Camellia lanceoleosa]
MEILSAYNRDLWCSKDEDLWSVELWCVSNKQVNAFLRDNNEKIKGTNDDIVDWSHGKRLWELSKEKYNPLWVKGGGHCNLETFPEYIKHLRKFLNAMEKVSSKKESKSRQAPTTSMAEFKHNKCLRFGLRYFDLVVNRDF